MAIKAVLKTVEHVWITLEPLAIIPGTGEIVKNRAGKEAKRVVGT
jgi:hypothetical protein